MSAFGAKLSLVYWNVVGERGSSPPRQSDITFSCFNLAGGLVPTRKYASTAANSQDPIAVVDHAACSAGAKRA